LSSTGYLKREALLGKSVVSKSAEIIGTVSDLAVSTDGRLAIQVQRKNPAASGDTSDLFIGAEDIQAVGDVVLLKSSSVGAPPLAPSSPVVSPSYTSTTSAVVSPPPPPGMIPQSRTCQKCGYVNAPNAKFCIKCGASLLQ